MYMCLLYMHIGVHVCMYVCMHVTNDDGGCVEVQGDSSGSHHDYLQPYHLCVSVSGSEDHE